MQRVRVVWPVPRPPASTVLVPQCAPCVLRMNHITTIRLVILTISVVLSRKCPHRALGPRSELSRLLSCPPRRLGLPPEAHAADPWNLAYATGQAQQVRKESVVIGYLGVTSLPVGAAGVGRCGLSVL